MLEPFDQMADDVACVIGEADPTECKGCPHNLPFACFRCPVFLELRRGNKGLGRGAEELNVKATKPSPLC